MSLKTRDNVTFFVNGKAETVSGSDVFMTLAEWLRYKRSLVGTKIVCAEGDCGACTVLLARPIQGSKKPIEFEAINSCIAITGQMDGCHITTVEGLKKDGEFSPVQKSMIECNGSQCGFCTPGFVMAMSWMLEKNKPVDSKSAKNHLTGNLCRCTGYQPIIDASILAGKLRDEAPKSDTLTKRYLTSANLKNLKLATKKPVQIESDDRLFYAPQTVKELSAFRKKYPNSLIVGAATDLGVQYNKGKRELTQIVSLHAIPEFYEIKTVKNKIRVGARVTLAELRRELSKTSEKLAEVLDLFASPQIKNAATLIGNVANASPIGDTPPILLALNARVEILPRAGGKRIHVPLDRFFLGYRKTKLKPGDVITAIEFDLPKKDEIFRFYKNSQRKDLDISCVNASIWMKKDPHGKVLQARIACGGVAATPIRVKTAEKALLGTGGDRESIELAVSAIQESITPISDFRGTSAYRRVLVQNVFTNLIRKAFE